MKFHKAWGILEKNKNKLYFIEAVADQAMLSYTTSKWLKKTYHRRASVVLFLLSPDSEHGSYSYKTYHQIWPWSFFTLLVN
jgi:hypothetical protein